MSAARRLGPLGWFVAVAYAISWGWTFPLAAARGVVRAGVGWPTSIPALAGPILAAFLALVGLEVRARRRGNASILGSRSSSPRRAASAARA